MSEPIPMILICPCCNGRHIDKDDFATKPHHTHACQHCGAVWRPALGPTVGVTFLPGFKNTTSDLNVLETETLQQLVEDCRGVLALGTWQSAAGPEVQAALERLRQALPALLTEASRYNEMLVELQAWYNNATPRSVKFFQENLRNKVRDITGRDIAL